MKIPSLRLPSLAWAGLTFACLPAGPLHSQPISSPAQTAPAGESTPEARQDHLERYFRALRMALREGPRDRIAVEAVVALCEGDVQRAFAWVRDHTQWVPYEGILRGPRGVLMDRLGNDWDRSLLLLALCEQMGAEARLAQAAWSEEALEGLGDRLLLARQYPGAEPNTLDPMEFARRARLPEEAFRISAETTRWKQAQTSQQIAQQVETLVAALSSALGVEQAAPAAESSLAPSIGSLHVWVQVQQAGQWVDLDPIDREGAPGSALLSAEQTFSGSEIPEDRYHHVTFRAIAEQWQGADRREHNLVELDLRALDTVGETIGFSMAPMNAPLSIKDLAGSDSADAYLKSLAAQESEWLPSFVFQDKPTYKNGIRSNGEVDTKPQMTATGKAVARGADALGQMGKAAQGAGAGLGYTAQWLEVERRGPGGAPEVTRRALFDLVGAAARATGGERPELPPSAGLDRNLRLTGVCTILPLASDVPEAFVERLAMFRLWNQKDLVEQLSEGKPLKPEQWDSALQSLKLFEGTLWGFARGRILWNPSAASYIDRLNLVLHHERPVLGGAGEVLQEDGLDIVWNGRAPFEGSSSGFAARLRQGVTDSAAEAMVLAAKNPENTRSFNLCTHAGPWKVVRSAEGLEELASTWPADVRAQMGAQLASNHVLVVPDGIDESLAAWQAGYWSLNPTSGQCLSLGGQG
ncbi:MAG: hypothetical protein H6829_13770, partial [Planctomycetes bacterium]|nr:hypothetical protein [Planctomycetota bacterium]